MLLELLYSIFGYYFTTDSKADFGSGDLYQCHTYCDNQPGSENFDRTILLLFFIRAFVCNYLMDKGFKSPPEILPAAYLLF